MSVLLWVTEGSWAACIKAAKDLQLDSDEVLLLAIVDDDVAELAHGAFAGLLGRRRGPGRDPGDTVETMSVAAADALLERAAGELGGDPQLVVRHGEVEREVVAAAQDARLLICGRTGDVRRVGPHSLGHATRFVVDHAACPVLLVWPEPPQDRQPPPPPHHHHHPGEPHGHPGERPGEHPNEPRP